VKLPGSASPPVMSRPGQPGRTGLRRNRVRIRLISYSFLKLTRLRVRPPAQVAISQEGRRIRARSPTAFARFAQTWAFNQGLGLSSSPGRLYFVNVQQPEKYRGRESVSSICSRGGVYVR